MKAQNANSPAERGQRHITITEEIREQILTIRDTGRTNMFDVITVQRIAHEMEFYELVNFIEEHRSEYCNFILRGKSNTKTD